MKARRNLDFGIRDIRLWTVAAILLIFVQTAESQSLSEGKNLFQLRESLREPAVLSSISWMVPSLPTNLPSPIFLPRWSAAELPFFCRIEHDFAKKTALPVKFRLGSVEYVDWLEGKNSSFSH